MGALNKIPVYSIIYLFCSNAFAQSKTIIEALPKPAPQTLRNEVHETFLKFEKKIREERQDLINQWPSQHRVTIHWKACDEPRDGIRNTPLRIQMISGPTLLHNWENSSAIFNNIEVFEGRLEGKPQDIEVVAWLSMDKPDDILPLSYGVLNAQETFNFSLVPNGQSHFELSCQRKPNSLKPKLTLNMVNTLDEENLGFEEDPNLPPTWSQSLAQIFKPYPQSFSPSFHPQSYKWCLDIKDPEFNTKFIKSHFKSLIPFYRSKCRLWNKDSKLEAVFYGSDHLNKPQFPKMLNSVLTPTQEPQGLEQLLLSITDKRPHWLLGALTPGDQKDAIKIYQGFVYQFLTRRKEFLQNKDVSKYYKLSDYFLSECKKMTLPWIDGWPNFWHCPTWEKIVAQDKSVLSASIDVPVYKPLDLPTQFLFEDPQIAKMRAAHNSLRLKWAACLQPELYRTSGKSKSFPSYEDLLEVRKRVNQIQIQQIYIPTSKNTKTWEVEKETLLKTIFEKLNICRTSNEK